MICAHVAADPWPFAPDVGSNMLVPGDPFLSQYLDVLVGFLGIGIFAAFGPFLSEVFPTQVRTTRMSFCVATTWRQPRRACDRQSRRAVGTYEANDRDRRVRFRVLRSFDHRSVGGA